MPRYPSRRVAAERAFPNVDGASGSASREQDIPQLLPPADSVSMATAQRLQAAAAVVGRGGGHSEMEEDPGEESIPGDRSDFDEELQDEDIEVDEEEMEGEEEQRQEDDDEEMQEDERFSSAPIPPNLREISSLASWTVSSYKPGCGVAALRNPSPSLFWQSDGPQPHTLTLHFFKRVAIVRMRVYLDFELDESYTPTKMVFLAGMGGNDLVEFATWQGESPCGWVDINLEGVGGRYARPRKRKHRGKKSETTDDDEGRADKISDDDDQDSYEEDIDIDDPSAGNVLKAMVIQVRICENHQNGKDTHVRGFQVFARDDKYFARRRRSSTLPHKNKVDATEKLECGAENDVVLAKFDEADWLQEPEIR
ncbi:hypothetical protein VTO42DRAFT_3367 [Malbranchea cinnamomea]